MSRVKEPVRKYDRTKKWGWKVLGFEHPGISMVGVFTVLRAGAVVKKGEGRKLIGPVIEAEVP